MFKYMSKCDGYGRQARSAVSTNSAVVNATAVSAGVIAHDTTAARNDLEIKGSLVVEVPRPNDVIDKAQKQTIAIVKPQRVGAKKSIKKRHDICPSKASIKGRESIVKPIERLPRLCPWERRPKLWRDMRRANDERSKKTTIGTPEALAASASPAVPSPRLFIPMTAISI